MPANTVAYPPPGISESRAKVLIVDDRVENLQALEVLLRELDVTLVRASSGNEALTLTLEHEFALVLLDVQMPGMDGFEVVELLRQSTRTRHLPVIFLSAIFSGDYYKIRGVEAGAVDFIEKPIVPEILIGKVRVFLDLHRNKLALKQLNENLEARVCERTADLAEEIKRRQHIEEDLKRTVQMLRQSNRELENFAYCCSHDLKEPLRTIVSFSQLLQQEYRGRFDDEADRFIGFIADAAINLDKLVQGILSFSRVDAASDAFEPVNCSQVLQDTLSELDVAIREQGARIEVEPLPTLSAVEFQIRQLFQNLIGNALKFNDGSPPLLRITAEEQADVWLFRFADNGIGIEPKYFERIFLMFQRLHPRHEYPGSGLGLALCKKIVEFHQGTIWVESTPGAGSTFSFTLKK